MENQPLHLRYKKPANDWENEALPIGNGRLGGMVFGGIQEERIQFNEESLFSGKPSKVNLEAHKELQPIRDYLAKQDYAAAQHHANEIFLEKSSYGDRSDFGMYQNFGDIAIIFDHPHHALNYIRELSLDEGIARVSYTINGKQYLREYFSSYPDDLMVLRFTCSETQSLHMTFRYNSGQENSKVFVKNNNKLILEGQADYLDFQASLLVTRKGGKLVSGEDSISVQGADEVVVYFNAATDYLPVEPNFKGKDYATINKTLISHALEKGYEALKTRHIQDHQQLFHRLSLQITGVDDKHLPTNERLVNYRDGREDAGLETLLFQYGRYLLIASSREGGLPANLQGIWNNSNNPVWGSMFCFNINLNMNYWHAQTTNLSECHMPLIQFIDSMRASGRISAKAYFNVGGWFAAKKSDLWRFTQPYAEAKNGLFMGGSGWLCQDVWEYYSFTRDEEYLRNIAYPIIKESAQFYLDFLVENEDGYLVSSPTTSPEHHFKLEGASYSVSDGTEIDHRIVEELYNNCIESSRILGIDEEFRELLMKEVVKIAPTKIGRNGNIQEWYHDWDDAEVEHRHLSHLYGVHPGHAITPAHASEFVYAAKVSLDRRGDLETGWSRAWKVNLWARLWDGNRAYKIISNIVKDRTNDNLFTTHPPFQIDGNFGFTAGVAEMLLQSSYAGEIRLLPALPDQWGSGQVSGLKARGGFEVSMTWSEGRLTSATIQGKPSSQGRLRHGKELTAFVIPENGIYEYTRIDPISWT
ncbi:hypothetical protein BC351_36385 [Paenibacillus ferrarius]|uniref:Uncharacterized protein n=1 Tax=Paenibacillus ferrarius TaxID=1469647 RepID=A0A1V4HDB5_9BACL|nr:glycoside hydrolase family 95 protein [Paenibacillus ferrarius]OPH50121.1 hypothetical protein BC351_36385 [Paenibacillus ferrarius]